MMKQEDKDNFCNAVRAEVKQAGMMDTTDNCWDFFIDKVCLSHKDFFPKFIAVLIVFSLRKIMCISYEMAKSSVQLEIRVFHDMKCVIGRYESICTSYSVSVQ